VRLLNKLMIFFLTGVILTACLGPLFLEHSPETQNLSRRLEPPSQTYWLGTDSLGRDMTSRILQGTRLSLLIGFSSTLIALLIGTITGAIAGFFRGRTEVLILGVIDFFGTFPTLLLAMLVSMATGRGLPGILISVALIAWLQHARLVRAQVIQARQLEYVEAARALGLNPYRILWVHILPNIKGPILISASAQIPSNVMAESFLSFLGLGVHPPFASLGTLASDGSRLITSHPHLIFAPGATLFLTLLAAQYLGDSIRDYWAEEKHPEGRESSVG